VLIAQIPWDRATQSYLLVFHPNVYPGYLYYHYYPSRTTVTEHKIEDCERDYYDRIIQKVPETSPREWICHAHSRPVRLKGRMALNKHLGIHYKHTPRYQCSCGVVFTQSPEALRHVKEQSLCTVCQHYSVGRDGRDGKCRDCM